MMSGEGLADLPLAISPDGTTTVLTSTNAEPFASTMSVIPSQAPWDRFQSAEEFEAWLIEASIAEWGHLFGQPAYYSGWYWGRPLIGDGMLLRENAFGLTASADSNFSSTNVQVAGVDEADLVETDGNYLYIISGEDLVIVQAGVGDDLRVVSRAKLEGRPVGMYLSGDRLAIVSSTPDGFWDDIWFVSETDPNVSYESTRPTTQVTVLDISDRSAPALVQKTELDGRLVTSRAVDGQLRLVLSNELRLPMPIIGPVQTEPGVTPEDGQLKPIDRPIDSDIELIVNPIGELQPVVPTMRVFPALDYWWPISTGTYETQEEYLARVRDQIQESMNPRIRNLALDGSVVSDAPLFEGVDLNRPESLFNQHITTIATFDLASNAAGPISKASVLSGAPQVYSSADSVYVFAAANWRSIDWTNLDGDGSPKTNVWKFDIDPSTHIVQLAAKGAVDGTLLNQFAADEHDGYLCVVTKSDMWGSSGQSLFVLEQVGHRLEVVGSLTGIAPNENLYSVRFVGQRAFFVTFRRVDPLFSADLSNPQDPQLLGELHIPGYSDYLQPIDENHLVAIGRGADEVTGMFEELQVSIFDVTNMDDPQLLHRYSFDGGRSTSTLATGNRWLIGDGDHHAVSYFPSEQVFALPISSADSWFWQGDDAPTFEAGHHGLQVFTIDVHSGIVPIGFIEHEMPIERSVQIGDHLYAISSGAVSVHEITDPTMELGRISIAAESDVPLVQLTMFQPAVTESPSISLTVSVLTSSDATAVDDTPEQAIGQRVSLRWLTIESLRRTSAGRADALVHMPAPHSLDADLVRLLAIETRASRNLGEQSPVDAANRDDYLFDDEQTPMDLLLEIGPRLSHSTLTAQMP